MACSGFVCSRYSLIFLNIIYIIVSLILISVAAYGRAVAVVTSLTLVGSLIACGVFLFLIALVGLLGAAKHNQVLLFFYMIILFILFLLQFSLACACLAVNSDQKDKLAETGWRMSSNMTRSEVQAEFNCCGFKLTNLPQNDSLGHPPCDISSACCKDKQDPCCTGNYPNSTAPEPACSCRPCFQVLQPLIYNAFSVTGGLGLFFSFTEVVGVWLTYRYRSQRDPASSPSAYL